MGTAATRLLMRAPLFSPFLGKQTSARLEIEPGRVGLVAVRAATRPCLIDASSADLYALNDNKYFAKYQAFFVQSDYGMCKAFDEMEKSESR